MLPETSEILFLLQRKNSGFSNKTFRIFNGKIQGFIDEKEALIQSLNHILLTQRLAYTIFSHDYGAEFEDLFSINQELFEARIKTRITEALLCDDRVKNIVDFKISRQKNSVFIDMKIESIFGDFDYERVM